MSGYTGSTLWIDLSSGEYHEEKVSPMVYEQVIGGVGLAAALLYDRIPPGADALGPENILAFTAGPLTATGSLFAGRWMAAGKSPLTGTWGDANCGGTLAPAIKQCGYDAIFFKGKSDKPVYLYLDNLGPQIRDASHLWGKDCVETEETLNEEIASKRRLAIASIGMAGEKLSLISGIVNDKGRIAARSGLGAVMGSKRLKAIVLAGNKPVSVHDKDRLKQLTQKFTPYTKSKIKIPSANLLAMAGGLMRKLPFQMYMDGLMTVPLFRQYGTACMNQTAVEWGDAPVKNWAGSEVDYLLNLSRGVSPAEVEKREKKKYHCYSCPLGCGGIFSNEGREGETHKPEYETTNGFGAMVLNDDYEAIIEINDMLNRAGMDSISAGNAVAFAMECFEKGWLPDNVLGGLDLSWGNVSAMKELVKRMITREGMGDILADGVKAAAIRLGNGTHAAAMHAGGQELGFHDPRMDPGYGLLMSVDPTPGKHTNGSLLYYEMYRLWKADPSLPDVPMFYGKGTKFSGGLEKSRSMVATSEWTWLYSSAGLCMFGANIGADRIPVFEWLNAACGWEKSAQEYMEIGRRIQTLRQMFNIRQGVDPLENMIPDRVIGKPPMLEGANRSRSFDLPTMASEYWQQIGWDAQTGVPLQATIESLGIDKLLYEVRQDGHVS